MPSMSSECQDPQPSSAHSIENVGAIPPSEPPLAIAILGAGMWGSALAQLAAANGHGLRLWSRRQSPPLQDCMAGVTVVICAVSMAGVPAVAAQLHTLNLSPQVVLVSATKGLEPGTARTPSQIWQQALPHNPIVVLSGPNLSPEIAQGLPAATVMASDNAAAAQLLQRIFASDSFRVYTNADRLGTELGGTLKNVIAIAVGVCDGLRLGTNARSALITRALPEIIRMGTFLGGQTETFFGLSGLGDLLTTCTSPLSRNYQVGYQLAQGRTLAQVLLDLQGTAEGVNTTQVVMHLAQREQIPVPITQEVYRLLQGQVSPQDAVEALMERKLKPEVYD